MLLLMMMLLHAAAAAADGDDDDDDDAGAAAAAADDDDDPNGQVSVPINITAIRFVVADGELGNSATFTRLARIWNFDNQTLLYSQTIPNDCASR
jgi:hypothetical protein